MTRSLLLSASILALAASTGCSSSSSSVPFTNPGNDSGVEQGDGGGGGATDGSMTGDDGGGSTTDSGAGGGNDAHATGDGATGAADAATSCTAATSVPTPPMYTPVTHQSACSMADVTAWVTACASQTATNASCSSWFQTAANATCGACIEPSPTTDGGAPPVTGATIYDQNGNPYVNVSACVALTDMNTTCAAPLEQLLVCHYDACGSDYCLTTATQAQYDACAQASDTGACSTYHTAAAPCGADQVDGGALGGACSTINDIITKICGNGQ